MSKVSIKFFPNEGKVKDGKIPIYVRIGYKKQKAEHRLNADVVETDMGLWNERLMRFDKPNFVVNDHLDNVSTALKQFVALNVFKLHEFDAKRIRDTVFNLSNDDKTIPLWKNYYHEFYSNSIKSKSSISEGTKKNYRKAINHMDNFLKQAGLEKIRVDEININMAKNFCYYLQNEKTVINNKNIPQFYKGMSDPSALSQIKKFRTINENALDEELVTKNYFKKIRLSNMSPLGDNLNAHQVNLLMTGDYYLTPTLKLYKNIFLWSVFTGLAFDDAVTLESGKITQQSEGIYRLTSRRGKTAQSYDQFLCKPAIEIMEEFKMNPEVIHRGTVLPKRSLTQMNKYLKIISDIFKFPINLTSHVARRTFRQLIAESGYENESVIKKMMGHSNSRNMDSRYFKVTERPLLAAKEKFDTFMSNEILAKNGKTIG